MEKLFNVVKKGYDQEEVDQYLNTLEEIVKSYKEKDDSIKNAIINAQISADNIVKNAELEAEHIKRRAVTLLHEIKASIGKQRQVTRDFQKDYTGLLSKYLHSVNDNDVAQVLSKLDELELYLQTMQEAYNPAAGGVVPQSPPPTQQSKPTPQAPPVAPPMPPADKPDSETVALVAELLAKDKAK